MFNVVEPYYGNVTYYETIIRSKLDKLTRVKYNIHNFLSKFCNLSEFVIVFFYLCSLLLINKQIVQYNKLVLSYYNII